MEAHVTQKKSVRKGFRATAVIDTRKGPRASHIKVLHYLEMLQTHGTYFDHTAIYSSEFCAVLQRSHICWNTCPPSWRVTEQLAEEQS